LSKVLSLLPKLNLHLNQLFNPNYLLILIFFIQENVEKVLSVMVENLENDARRTEPGVDLVPLKLVTTAIFNGISCFSLFLDGHCRIPTCLPLADLPEGLIVQPESCLTDESSVGQVDTRSIFMVLFENHLDDFVSRSVGSLAKIPNVSNWLVVEVYVATSPLNGSRRVILPSVSKRRGLDCQGSQRIYPPQIQQLHSRSMMVTINKLKINF
jgi:hypothetical protein